MIVHAKCVHVSLVMVMYTTGVSILQSQCFVNSEQSFVFDNASVMVLPHYKYGSLLVSTCTCTCVYMYVNVSKLHHKFSLN